MRRLRVLDRLCLGLSTLLRRLKLSNMSKKVAGSVSKGLLTAILMSPSGISSPLELILVLSRLVSLLQNSSMFESGGL